MAEATPQMSGFVGAMQGDYVIVDSLTGRVAPVKRALANIAQSQTNAVVVAAVPGKKIRVLSYLESPGATATDMTWGSGSSGAISALHSNAAKTGKSLGYHPAGHMETVAGEALTITTGAGSTTGLDVTYVEV